MNLWIIADIAILAVIAVWGYISMKKGFINSSFRGLSSFISLILVLSFHIPFQGYLEQSVIGDTVREKIELKVEKAIQGETTEEKADNTAADVVEKMELPEFMSGWLTQAFENDKRSELKESITESLADFIFPLVMQIISVIVLYFLIKFLLYIVLLILKNIVKIPILRTVDKALGMLMGGINAILTVYAAAAIIMLLIPSESGAVADINNTFLFKYFYYNNLIINLFF